MEISKLTKKIKSRGHWVIILEPLKELDRNVKNLAPRDKYQILKDTSVKYRGWPVPYFPNIGEQDPDQDFLKMSEDISAGIDWEHYKQSFTLFESGQFVLISGANEDWVDESEALQMSDLKFAKPHEILSFVSTTYYLTEIFVFISKLISSNLYKDINNFNFRFYLKNTDKRKLRIFGNRVEFSKDYSVFAEDIKIYDDIIDKKDFVKTWKIRLLNTAMRFYKHFGDYDPNPKVIQSDIDNLLERKY